MPRAVADVRDPSLRRVLIALCITVTTSWGLLYYSLPVLAARIEAETDWPAGAPMLAFSAALIISALLAVPVGKIIDRHGPRWVMTIGSVVGAAALALIGVSANFAMFVCAWVLAGVAMAGVLYQPAFAAIAGWFGGGSLTPITILTLVAGLASTIFAPLVALAEAHVGWQGTYVWAGVVLGVLTIPIHLLVLRREWPAHAAIESRRQGENETSGRTLTTHAYTKHITRSAQFWLLLGGLAAMSAAVYSVLISIMPLMIERGLTTESAAWVLGLGGVGQVLGRIFYTTIASRVSLAARTATVLAMVTFSTAAFAILEGPLIALVLVSMVAGMARGVATLLQATAVTDRWGNRAYGYLSGMLSLPAQFIGALAPWIGALIANSLGSYAAAFGVFALIAVAASGFMMVSARGTASSHGIEPREPAHNTASTKV